MPQVSAGMSCASAAAPITVEQAADRRPGPPLCPGMCSRAGRARRVVADRVEIRRVVWAARSGRDQRVLPHPATMPARCPDPPRSRRSVHAIPGASARFLAKAPTLAADEVFLDLEDGAAATEGARSRAGDRGAADAPASARRRSRCASTATDTPHYYRDLIARRRAGRRGARRGDRAQGPHARRRRDDRQAADADRARERPGGRADRHRGADRGRARAAGVRGDRHRVAADGGAGLRARRLQRRGRDPGHDDRRRARRLPRRPSQLRLLTPGDGGSRRRHPGDRRPLRADRRHRRAGAPLAPGARARGRRQVDDPPLTQIAVVNEIFSPTLEEFARASALLAALATRRRAAPRRFGGEMIDEASRRMAERVMIAGRAAGTRVTSSRREATVITSPSRIA